MLVYIMDTCSPITIEQESKNLTDKVVVNLTFFHILVALGASVKAFLLATFADFTPLKPLGKGCPKSGASPSEG
jgi:hypothetical protein